MMASNILSIRGHNVYGNICVGVCLLASGLSLNGGGEGFAPLLCFLGLLMFAGLSFAACISRHHEPSDEMSIAHDGQAASFALRLTLITIGMLCCLGIVTGATISLDVACCIALGFAMLLYGCAFAWLERG